METSESPSGQGAIPALKLDPGDNVAVATRPLSLGDELMLDGRSVTLCDPIAFGHKFALAKIPEGGRVRKYGEVIGIATSSIPAGAHVHVHNVVSARLPGVAAE